MRTIGEWSGTDGEKQRLDNPSGKLILRGAFDHNNGVKYLKTDRMLKL